MLWQAMLRNAGKAEVLGSMEDNDPDAADDDDEGREADEDSGQHNGQETNSMVDNLSSALQRTGLLGK